jgi:hypothetical protein
MQAIVSRCFCFSFITVQYAVALCGLVTKVDLSCLILTPRTFKIHG